MQESLVPSKQTSCNDKVRVIQHKPIPSKDTFSDSDFDLNSPVSRQKTIQTLHSQFSMLT